MKFGAHCYTYIVCHSIRLERHRQRFLTSSCCVVHEGQQHQAQPTSTETTAEQIKFRSSPRYT